jgi:ubiquinone/menaquinone biosynthesis C-methylase UbiE
MTLNDASFRAIAPYYDLLMRDVPYKGWVEYLHQLLDEREFRPRRILDLACGTGSVAEILAAQGYEVVGVDLSEPMIERARKKAEDRGFRIRYYAQDAAELRIPEEPFDLCVSFFDSLNYIVEPPRLETAIARVYEHLRPGGLFIFDVNSVFALEGGFFDQDNTHTHARLRYVWRSGYDPKSRLCTVNMRFFLRGRDGVDQEFRETHVQFAYEDEELREMLRSAGFFRVQAYNAYSMLPVRPTSDRIFFVAERPA